MKKIIIQKIKKTKILENKVEKENENSDDKKGK